MERSEFDREVEYLMKPIQEAGYTSLLYDKTMGSLEDQLRFQSDDAIVKLLGGGPLLSKFSIVLNTVINEKPVRFSFKIVCDADSRQSIYLSGMNVKVGRRREY